LARWLETDMAERQSPPMTSNSIDKLTSEQFVDRIILSKADALVKVSSTCNGASQILYKTFQLLAEKYASRVNFFTLDFDSEAGLSETYRVEAVPTILFFKQGTLVDKLSGLTHRTILSHKINQLINS
jgi:thioredoxin 1